MYDVNKFNEFNNGLYFYTMMKKLMIILALVVGMTFAGCSDDEEEVQPKQTVEQIAEKIDSFMPQSLTIRTGTGSYSDVTSYRIECPFLIIEHEKDNHTYFSLNHLLKMWYVLGTLYLYFE